MTAGGAWPRHRRGERGSALVIAVLVMVVLAMLGISFLFMAETDNRITVNEKRRAQTLYVGESVVRAVKRWFDHPDRALFVPDDSIVDRTLRRVIDESDPYDPADVVAADGVVGSVPYFKQGIDADGDGADDLFEKPYRTGRLHSLLGTPDGPDMRIDRTDASAADFLDQLGAALLGSFPGEGGGVRATIRQVDLYAPPYQKFGSTWLRYGIATVSVLVRIDRGPGTDPLAERTITAVLSEAPYWGAFGPLHACADVSFVPQGAMSVHWGPIVTTGDIRLGTSPGSLLGIPRSLPRSLPPAPAADAFAPPAATDFSTFATDVLDGQTIDDPWFRILAAGRIWGAPAGLQPFAPPPPPAAPQDRSNLLQSQSIVRCPDYDYTTWKAIALSGDRDMHYFAHVGSGQYREHGTGSQGTLADLTRGRTGVFFFDTADGLPPTDSDADGAFENLAPAVTLSGSWDFTGFLYVNTESLRFDGATGSAAGLAPPGEPFLDPNTNGRFDGGEPWVNLVYPDSLAGLTAPITVDGTHPGGTPVRDARGAVVSGASVSMLGILVTHGRFEATGTGSVYGSVIAIAGVTQTPADGSAPTPTIFWDATIGGDWPPSAWDLPRVVVTEWDPGDRPPA